MYQRVLLSVAAAARAFVEATQAGDPAIGCDSGEGLLSTLRVVRETAIELVIAIALVCAMLGAAAISAHAAAGDLDLSFDGDGRVTTNIDNTLNNGFAFGTAVQSDGKIIAVGYSWSGTQDFAVVRYVANGSNLDTTFGDGGKVITSVGASHDIATSVAIQPDGKIVVAGYSWSGGYNNFAVVRYNTDGSLDTTFSDDGKVITTIGAQASAAYGLALQSDGKIVVAGESWNGANWDFAAVRYADDGTLDTSFSGDGIATIAVLSSTDSARSVAIQDDGKIVLAGFAYNGSHDDMAVVRLLTGGSVDTTFSGDGKMTADFQGGNDSAAKVALQADGKIVAAGKAYIPSDDDFALLRLNTNGTLDTDFDTDGRVTTDFFVLNDEATALSIQADGKIVVGGSAINGATWDFAVARYTPLAGALDTTFSGDGRSTNPIGTDNDFVHAMAIQSDGKIVLAGRSDDGSGGTQFALSRYGTGGTLDTTFSGDGKLTTPVGATADYALGTAVQTDGRIVVAGYFWDGAAYQAGLVRYNPDGGLDTGFGTGGKVKTLVDGSFIPRAVAIDGNGKIVVAGDSYVGVNNWDAAVTRYLSNGALDTGFSGDGRVSFPFISASSNDSALAVAIQGDNKVVVAGTSFNGTSWDVALARLTTAGGLDTSFSGDGKVVSAVGTADERARAIDIQSDGKIVVAGPVDNGTDNDFLVMRFTAAGSLDTSFSGDGIVTTTLSSGSDDAMALTLQPDGKIVVAGSTGGYFGLVRYLTNGSLDTGFSGDGITTTSFGTGWAQYARAVRLQTDGKIVTAGYVYNGSNWDFAIARYDHTNGALDASFAGDGTVITDFGGTNDQGMAIAIQDDARIVVAGIYDKNNDGSTVGQDYAVARYLVEGTCGNSTLELGEDCDDGNAVGGDCCSASCQFESAGAACGDPSSTSCDNPDTCDGSGSCLSNFKPSSTVCRSSGGVCDVAETCTGSSATCPSDGFVSSATVCRVSAGVCDVAETCTGSSAACPADGRASAGTVCRASAGVCDVSETCNGTATTCPTDAKVPSGTVCRASTGICDLAETCNGTATTCPADGFVSSTTVCRASAGTCDVVERCTGSSAICPADGFAASTTVCRAAAAGGCDVAENCTGSAAACPTDAYAASTTVCRAAAGPCDAAETCSGTSVTCPSDVRQPAGAVCRGSVDLCDAAETCNGTATTCPTDLKSPSGTVCRAAIGTCDVPETCNGSVVTCPADTLVTAGTVCRAATGTCDIGETCDGASGACPADAFEAAGVACAADSTVCTSDTCDGAGTCVLGNAVFCSDGNPCTQDSCDDVLGCQNVEEPVDVGLCLTASKIQLQVKNTGDPLKSQIKWKWGGGDAFAQADLGTPTEDTTYSLCVYDTTTSSPYLAAWLDIPANSLWVSKDPKGMSYVDKPGGRDGVQKLQLKTGADFKTKAQVKAGGVNLPMLTPANPGVQFFAQDPNVVVQLLNSEGLCLTSEFPAASAIKNDGVQFKAKTP